MIKVRISYQSDYWGGYIDVDTGEPLNYSIEMSFRSLFEAKEFLEVMASGKYKVRYMKSVWEDM